MNPDSVRGRFETPKKRKKKDVYNNNKHKNSRCGHDRDLTLSG